MARIIEKVSHPIAVRRSSPGFTEQLLEPFSRLRSEMDQLLDTFPTRMPHLYLGSMSASNAMPAIEMTETDKAYKLAVEIPGMESGDIDVSVSNNVLCITGEKKEEREEKERGFLFSERSYGAFERRIDLPPDVNPDKIDARVAKGVLHISLPRDLNSKEKKRQIKIKAD